VQKAYISLPIVQLFVVFVLLVRRELHPDAPTFLPHRKPPAYRLDFFRFPRYPPTFAVLSGLASFLRGVSNARVPVALFGSGS
jgi:hypothetical protein